MSTFDDFMINQAVSKEQELLKLKAQNAAQREVLRKVGAILADQLVVHRLDEARDVINAALSPRHQGTEGEGT